MGSLEKNPCCGPPTRKVDAGSLWESMRHSPFVRSACITSVPSPDCKPMKSEPTCKKPLLPSVTVMLPSGDIEMKDPGVDTRNINAVRDSRTYGETMRLNAKLFFVVSLPPANV